MKWIKRTFIFIAGFLLLLICTCFALSKIYESELSDYALNWVNQKIKARLLVEQVHISVWDEFPNLTAKLKEPIMLSPNQVDTVLQLRSFDLTFELSSILSGKYNIANIRLTKGRINWQTAYTFNDFIEVKSDQSTDQLNLGVNQLKIDEVTLLINNPKKKITCELALDNLNFNGLFSTTLNKVEAQGALNISYLQVNTISYLQDKPVKLNISMSNNAKDDKWIFAPSKIFYTGLPMNFSGYYQSDENEPEIAIEGIARQWNLAQVVDELVWLPDYKKEWKIDGAADLKLIWNGKWQTHSSPYFSINAKINQASWEWEKHHWHLKNILFEGGYESKTKNGIDKLSINTLSANQDEAHISLKGAIARLEKPLFNLWGNADFQLNMLSPWTDTMDVHFNDGSASIQFKSKGQLTNPTITWQDFFGAESEYLVNLKNGNINMGNFTIKNLHSEFKQIAHHASFRNLNANVNNANITITGLARNWVHWVDGKKSLRLELDAEVDRINLNDWLTAIQDTEHSGEKKSGLGDIVALVKVSANDFSYQNISASKLQGLVSYAKGQLSSTAFRFNHAGGTFITNCSLQKNRNTWELTSNTTIKQVKIDELFKQWNNFNQQTITHQQISGIANAQALVDCNFTATGFDANSLYSLTKISLKDGEIRNNEALKSIGSYLEKNLVLKAFVKTKQLSEALNNLKFSELTNLIEVKQGKLFIPEMAINTNALAMNASGSHSFKQSIDYRFNFLLNDVLRHGNKGAMSQGFSNDGKRLFLKATGTVNQPDISLDRVAAKAHKESRKEEEIKQINPDRFSKLPMPASKPAIDSSGFLNRIKDKLRNQNPTKEQEEIEWEIEFPNQDEQP